jgi:hypothetical protein
VTPTEEIRKTVGLGKTQLHNLLNQLVEEGRPERPTTGVFAIAAAPVRLSGNALDQSLARQLAVVGGFRLGDAGFASRAPRKLATQVVETCMRKGGGNTA